MTRTLSLAQARRVAIAAQGLTAQRRGTGAATTRHLLRTLRALHVLQIDSVNVLHRAHCTAMFARVGPYDTGDLDALAVTRPARTAEYWAHEASLLTPETHRLSRWRMNDDGRLWGSMKRAAQAHPTLLADVVDYACAHGPLTARELHAALTPDATRNTDHWGWNWSNVKALAEYAFGTGLLTTFGRTTQFERRYADPHRVLAPNIVAAPYPSERDSIDQLITHATRAVGIGSTRRIADYFRIKNATAAQSLERLTAQGIVEPVTVRDLTEPLWWIPGTRVPRSVTSRALLTGFDNLIWHRDTTEQLFGMRFRIEIYVPAPKRVHGYYVLAFLLDDQLRARVDLKNDRASKTLLVQRLTWEGPRDAGVARELHEELQQMAAWLGCTRVDYR